MSSSNQSLPSSRERFKYDRASSVTNSIISLHNSYDSLKEKSNIYRRTNDQQYVQAHNDYQRYKYHKTIIQKFEDKFSGVNLPPQDNSNPPPQDNSNPPPQDNSNLSLRDNSNPLEGNLNLPDDETSTTDTTRNDIFVHSQVSFLMNTFTNIYMQ